MVFKLYTLCTIFERVNTIQTCHLLFIVLFSGKGDLFGCDLYDTETCIQSSGDVHALTYCDLMLVSRYTYFFILYIFLYCFTKNYYFVSPYQILMISFPMFISGMNFKKCCIIIQSTCQSSKMRFQGILHLI